MLSSGVVLLHDNARPHSAAATKRLLKRFRWEVFDNPPSSTQTWLPVIFISFLVENGRRRTIFWHKELQTIVENFLKARVTIHPHFPGHVLIFKSYRPLLVSGRNFQNRRKCPEIELTHFNFNFRATLGAKKVWYCNRKKF